MIFGKTKLELKVGIFTSVGLVILIIFILLIGDFRTWSSGYKVNFTFNFINGIKVGAPVRFAGVDAGEVRGINFTSASQEQKNLVSINAWVRKEIKIPVDSSVWVNTLGLLGEKYIEIMPGKDRANILQEGQALVGSDPIPMQEVTQIAKSIADNLDAIISRIKSGEGTIGKLFYDDTLYKDLEAFASDIRKNPWKLFFKTKEKK